MCPKACPRACDTHLIEIPGPIAFFSDHLGLFRWPKTEVTKFQYFFKNIFSKIDLIFPTFSKMARGNNRLMFDNVFE